MDTESIGNIFSSLLSTAREEAKTVVNSTRDLPEMQTALQALKDRNPDHFYLALLFPLSKVVRGVIFEEVGRCQEAEFLLMQREFVSSHLRRLIEQHEGGACSADKVRTIMRVAMRYYIDQQPIAFDYEGETTYHLPKKIFTDQTSILGFLNALKHLYYGNPDPYLQQIMRVLMQASQMDQSGQEGQA